MNWMAEEVAASRCSARRGRRLQRQQKQEQQQELNLVSMIDVFAVLVFFLLVSSSISATRLNILGLDLPSTASAPSQGPPPLTVSLLQDGLRIDSASGSRRLRNSAAGYDLKALSAALVEFKRKVPAEQHVTLLVDAEVSYDHVVQVMEVLRATPAAAQAVGLPAELFPLIAIGDVESAS